MTQSLAPTAMTQEEPFGLCTLSSSNLVILDYETTPRVAIDIETTGRTLLAPPTYFIRCKYRRKRFPHECAGWGLLPVWELYLKTKEMDVPLEFSPFLGRVFGLKREGHHRYRLLHDLERLALEAR